MIRDRRRHYHDPMARWRDLARRAIDPDAYDGRARPMRLPAFASASAGGCLLESAIGVEGGVGGRFIGLLWCRCDRSGGSLSSPSPDGTSMCGAMQTSGGAGTWRTKKRLGRDFCDGGRQIEAAPVDILQLKGHPNTPRSTSDNDNGYDDDGRRGIQTTDDKRHATRHDTA